jgi:hypothetical protein
MLIPYKPVAEKKNNRITSVRENKRLPIFIFIIIK